MDSETPTQSVVCGHFALADFHAADAIFAAATVKHLGGPLSDRHPLENTGRSKEKAQSRSWMYQQYTQITGADRIAVGRQYWCLAGKIVDAQGRLQPLSEPLQAVREGLITPEQYYGFELDHDRAVANLRQRELPLNLITGNITTAIRNHIRSGTFQPALINLDTAHEPKEALALLAKVYRELRAHHENQPVIFLNLLITRWYQAKEYSDAVVIAHLQRSPLLTDESRQGMLTTGWRILSETHEYYGASTAARSRMKIYCFTHQPAAHIPCRELRYA